MQRRGKLFPIFFLFLLLSFFLIILSQFGVLTGVRGFFEQATVPVQKLTFGLFTPSADSSNESEKLRQQNNELRAELAKQKELEKENRALRDQFETTKPKSRDLLPAHVIGMPGFAPGVSAPDELLIDLGEREGIAKGDIVVVKDSLVGIISHVSSHISVVTLISQKDISFTAETVKNSVPGIIKGEGQGSLILGNVVLSDKLEKDDVVITSGDVTKDETGYPPGLIIGKIVAVNKKQSELFQSAEIESLVDVSTVRMVFVITNNE